MNRTIKLGDSNTISHTTQYEKGKTQRCQTRKVNNTINTKHIFHCSALQKPYYEPQVVNKEHEAH